MFFRTRSSIAAVLVGLLASTVLARDLDRPHVVDEIERRWDGEFMFVTSGDGSYDIYQRLETTLGSPREVVCLVRSSCYVQIASLPERDLLRADSDPEASKEFRELLTKARDDQRLLAAAGGADRAALEASWFAHAAKIASCLESAPC